MRLLVLLTLLSMFLVADANKMPASSIPEPSARREVPRAHGSAGATPMEPPFDPYGW